jgi:hypothetical protein
VPLVDVDNALGVGISVHGEKLRLARRSCNGCFWTVAALASLMMPGQAARDEVGAKQTLRYPDLTLGSGRLVPLFTARGLVFGLDVLHAGIPARWKMVVCGGTSLADLGGIGAKGRGGLSRMPVEVTASGRCGSLGILDCTP